MENVVSELGFVVIGRNEGERLKSCLLSVLRVSPDVVFADSASSDGSAELAESLGVAVVRLQDDGRLTAARGRNAGYQMLRSHFGEREFVQFIDGDCILQPAWIDSALTFIRARQDVAVVCGRRFEAHPDASPFNAMCDREWNTPVGEANECGGDALVRCEAFDQVGGYRSQLQAGEEPEMTARMRAAGWKIWRIDVPMVEHDAKIYRFGQWWRRTQRGGYGYAQVWSATGALRPRLYGRHLGSAFGWVVAVPIGVLACSFFTSKATVLLVLPLAYAVQLVRIRVRLASSGSWTNASLLLLAKVPEAIGACRFFVARQCGRVAEYKR